MGLICSHGAFDGGYHKFNRLRQAVCMAIGPGASFPPHYVIENGEFTRGLDGTPTRNPELDEEMWYAPDGYLADHPGMVEFLSHNDCDGNISPEMCAMVANELEAVLPNMMWMQAEARQFIDGCRRAAAAGEPLLFE